MAKAVLPRDGSSSLLSFSVCSNAALIAAEPCRTALRVESVAAVFAGGLAFNPVAIPVSLLAGVLLPPQVFRQAIVAVSLLLPLVLAWLADGGGLPGAGDEVAATAWATAALGFLVS